MIGNKEQEAGHIFLLSLHALRFPELHKATFQFADDDLSRMIDLPVGRDFPTLEADMLDPRATAAKQAQRLTRLYRPVGKYLAHAETVVRGSTIFNFLAEAAQVTELPEALEIEPDQVDLRQFVPDESVLENMHIIGQMRRCEPLVEFVLKQQQLAAAHTLSV